MRVRVLHRQGTELSVFQRRRRFASPQRTAWRAALAGAAAHRAAVPRVAVARAAVAGVAPRAAVPQAARASVEAEALVRLQS